MAKSWATFCCPGTYKNNYQSCCGIKVIKKRESFFRKLSEVNEIYVFGLSLSDVDLPCLAHMNSCCKEGTLWVFSDYRNRNAERIHSFCSLNNIKNMRIIELKELKYNRQLEIIFPE